MNLNLPIIGSSLASQLHTLIIPIIAYITINEYSTAFNNAFKIKNGQNISEEIIDTNRHNNTFMINRFIP